MKNKKTITYLTTIWFSLQAVFMFYWPIYLYYCDGIGNRDLGFVRCPALHLSKFETA